MMAAGKMHSLMYCDLHKRDVYATWEVLNQNNWCVYSFIYLVLWLY